MQSYLNLCVLRNYMKERLQKILAHAGVASRRSCEELIKEGRVKVNGKTIKLGDKADTEKDSITVNNRLIRIEHQLYIMLNKPKGTVSTVNDPFGRKTVLDLVKIKERIFPVGRLDKDAQGLLLLTNDGEFANKITHPRYEIKKTYEVLLQKPLSPEHLQKLKKGLKIDRRTVIPENIDGTKKVEITIHEGRKHIVKRLFERLGYRVKKLKRTEIGNLSLSGLQSGSWRFLTKTELRRLKLIK